MKHFILLILIIIPSLQASEVDMILNACQENKMMACYDVGLFYEEGTVFEQNLTQAAIYYARACEANIDEACQRLDKIHNK